MSDFFKGIDPVPFKGPDSDDPLAFRFYEKDRIVLGKPMREHLRMAIAYWHSFAWPGGDPFGGQTFERPWFRDGMSAAELKAEVAFEMFQILGADFFTFHDRDVAPEGRSLAESDRNVRGDRRHLRAEDGGDRRRPALGHGQPLLQPPLHGGRGDEPRPGGLRLRRGAGEELPRRHPRPQGRELRAVGRARGLRDAAQHRHEAGARPRRALPVDGRRLQAQDRLPGHDPDRAEAAGADQAPVRLRRRHGLRLPPALRAGEGGEGQHRDRPRRPRRPFLRARDRRRRSRSASSARSTPTATTTSRAGTPTSSRTTCRRRRWRSTTSSRAAG